jgi:hypothetical protein
MGPASDLDALIGEIRREAARRRAAPDFPIDEEARLTAEMDAEGPLGRTGGADLAAITAALRALGPEAGSSELAALTASAVTALTVRLTELERHAARPAPSGGAGPAEPADADANPGPADRADQGEPADRLADHWLDLLSGWVLREDPPAATGPGRVLMVGAGVDRWVAQLAGAGVDVYWLDPLAGAFQEQGRSGGLLEHLRSVGDGALALAVLAGPLPVGPAEQLDQLSQELARVAIRVAVCDEAPWAWRRRVGDARADTAARRPVGPEAWLAALTGAGFEVTARYGPGGSDFLVRAVGRLGDAGRAPDAAGPGEMTTPAR